MSNNSQNTTAKKSPDNGKTRPISASELHTAKTKSQTGKLPGKKIKDKKPKASTAIILNLLQCVLYIGAVVLVSYLLATNFIKMANDVFAFKKDDDVKYTITLGEYATLDQIADELGHNKIIKYPSIFKLYSKVKKDNGRFLVGSFELDSSMDYDTIRAILKTKRVELNDVRLTIPEGYTVDQIIDMLVEKNIGSREKYVDVINNYDFKYDFLPAMENIRSDRTYRLEGYLFPDTYDFSPTESEVEVISKFLRNFKTKFEAQYFEKARKLNMSVDDVIILASIVEKEAKLATDYELISSVFHNRLNNSRAFPRLESNATINYVLKEHTNEFTQQMLDLDNPYNTCKFQGLPPGPICNPGVDAIAYAFYPEKTSYYYFVANESTGETLYASNYAQHQSNVAKVKRAQKTAQN